MTISLLLPCPLKTSERIRWLNITLMTKMSAVGSSCVVRHDVPLERTHDVGVVGGKFCGFKCVFGLSTSQRQLCIMHN